MLLSWMMMKLMDPAIDEAAVKMLTEDYPDNPFLMVTIAEKLSPRAMMEAAMRAEKGMELSRPMGSLIVKSTAFSKKDCVFVSTQVFII